MNAFLRWLVVGCLLSGGALAETTSLSPVFNGGTISNLLVIGGGLEMNQNNVWSGTSSTQAPIWGNMNWSGTTGAVGGFAPLAQWININDAVNSAATTGSAGVNITMNAVTGQSGGVTGLTSSVTVFNTSTGGLSSEYVSLRATSVGNANEGGGIGTEKGVIIGLTSVGELTAAGTHYSNLSAGEFAIHALAGSSTTEKTMIWGLLYSDDAVRGSVTDAGIGLWSQYQTANGTGLLVGLQFGSNYPGLHNPVGSDGTFIKFVANSGGDNTTVGTILDFSAITSATFDILMPNFQVAGSGSLTATSVNAATSGGNSVQIVGGANGSNSTTIGTLGSDSFITMNIQTKGQFGAWKFSSTGTGASEQGEIDTVASAVSYFKLLAAASGNIKFDVGGTATGISIGPSSATSVALGNASAPVSSVGTLTAAKGIVAGGTTFTISGCSATTPVGGATAGTFLSGTTGACTTVITLNGATGITAPNGWTCSVSDLTTPANLISQSASSPTTCTVTGTTLSGDKLSFAAMAF